MERFCGGEAINRPSSKETQEASPVKTFKEERECGELEEKQRTNETERERKRERDRQTDTQKHRERKGTGRSK